MKQNKFWGIPAFVLVCAVLVTACPDLTNPTKPNPQQGYGTVNIIFGGGNARTLLPSEFDLPKLYYVLAFTQTDGTGQQTVSQTGQESVVVQLEAGTWNLDIRGHVSQSSASNASAAVVYYTENGIAVSSGANVTVNANLLPNTDSMTQNGTGTLSYDITIPQGATGTLTVLSLDGDVAGQPAALTQTVNRDDLDLPSGEYNISIVITHDGKEKTWWALAHIYDSAITRVVVVPDDFTDVLPDYGTITITLSMDDFTMIDEGYGVFDNVEQPIVLNKNGGRA